MWEHFRYPSDTPTNKTTALYNAALNAWREMDTSLPNGPETEALEEALAAFESPALRMVSAQCSCGKQMTVTQEYPVEQPQQEHPASLSKEAQPASMLHAAPVDAQSGGGLERKEQVQDRFNTGSKLNVSPVRVMSVDEVQRAIAAACDSPSCHPIYSTRMRIARALAKLGTIRVVEGKQNDR